MTYGVELAEGGIEGSCEGGAEGAALYSRQGFAYQSIILTFVLEVAPPYLTL